MSSTPQTKKGVRVTFAATDQYLEDVIVRPTEKYIPTKDMMQWGEKNLYPEYLLDLYNNVPTLRSIINGRQDYITGDDVSILPLNDLPAGVMNNRGDTIREQIRDIAHDEGIYGGYALQVIRNLAGGIAEIYYIDLRYLRTNKDCNVFYYCEDWKNSIRKEVITYPAFLPNLRWETLTDEERNRNAASILYVKNVRTQVYPAPLYAASVKACEIERMIDVFHISSLNNQFVSSAIVNFNNGIPEDNIKGEIEKGFNEKFSGVNNGGRVMFSWNPNKDSATTIQEFKIEDFGERYKALSEHSRQQIFTAFRGNPNLFGIPTEGNGFSNEEYAESFKLYNRTQIRPVQRVIADTYDKIYGQMGVLSITPFTMDGTDGNID